MAWGSESQERVAAPTLGITYKLGSQTPVLLWLLIMVTGGVPVNYKLAFAKGIDHLPLQRLNLCCCSCWLSICPEGNSGCRMRPFMHQGNWWNRSLGCYCSVAKLWLTVCDLMDCSTPGFPVLHHLPEFPQTHVHWVGDAIQPSHPLSPRSPPALNLSQHWGLFQWAGSSYQVAKLLKLQFSISPYNEYWGLISFRMDWFDLLAVQGTLRSLLQHHSSKASILQHSAFCMVQLSHPYMITRKNITLSRQTFAANTKVLALCFLIHCLGLP